MDQLKSGFLSSRLPARLWETSTPMLLAQTHAHAGPRPQGGRRRRRSLLLTRSFRILLLTVLVGYAGVHLLYQSNMKSVHCMLDIALQIC